MPRRTSSLNELDPITTKYSAVISLKNSEGEIQWNRFNAMLVANTIFIGLIGFTYNKDFNFPPIFRIMILSIPILGLLLCWSWYQMTQRGFMWTQYWMKKANQIEGQISGKINPIQDGKEYRDMYGVHITEKAAYRIIIIFAVIYFLILANNISLICH